LVRLLDFLSQHLFDLEVVEGASWLRLLHGWLLKEARLEGCGLLLMSRDGAWGSHFLNLGLTGYLPKLLLLNGRSLLNLRWLDLFHSERDD